MTKERFAVVARPNYGSAEMIVDLFDTRDEARECMDAKSDRFPKWDFRIEDMEDAQ